MYKDLFEFIFSQIHSPRGARLDAPGVLHRVMGRGIMRNVIFRDDTDRNDFVSRQR